MDGKEKPLGWRAWLLAGAALLIGATLVTPAIGHVNNKVGHLWKTHIKPKADNRYLQPCDVGAVKASAWVISTDGTYNMSAIPNTFTPTEGSLQSCMQEEMLIRRTGVGTYVVAFQDGLQRTAIAVPDASYGVSGAFAQTGFALHYGGGIIGNSVTIRSHDGTLVDSPFMIWLY